VSRQKHHGRKAWLRKSAHIMAARKLRVRKRLDTRCTPETHIPTDKLPSIRPQILLSITLQKIIPSNYLSING
jgi:hypothetical protein